MLTVEQVKKVGTLLPKITAKVRYTTVQWSSKVEDKEDDWWTSSGDGLTYNSVKVFGVRVTAGEDCIEVDCEDSNDTNYYVIPISELIRIGLVSEFVLPEKWYCPYSNREEFYVMDRHFNKNWSYITPNGKSGCNNNTYDNNWNSSIGEVYGTKITFEQFVKYVLKQETKTLPKVWAVKNDGSQLFKDTVVKWGNAKFYYNWIGQHEGAFYGVTEDYKFYYFFELEDFGEGVVELTIEQFLELTNLKKPDYYKLIKRMPGIEPGAVFKWLGDVYGIEGEEDWFFTEEQIKDAEFFEPIYKEEFKVGEHVYIIETENGAKGAEGKVGIFTNELGSAGLLCYNNDGGVRVRVQSRVWAIGKELSTVKLRKATPEEIESYNNPPITIDTYTFSFPKKGEVTINGKTYDKRFVEDLVNILENASDQIKSFNVGCSGQYKLDLPMLKKILARM